MKVMAQFSFSLQSLSLILILIMCITELDIDNIIAKVCCLFPITFFISTSVVEYILDTIVFLVFNLMRYPARQ